VVQPNEILMLLLGLGILVFILTSRQRLARLPSSGVLISSFCVALVGWVLTVVEGFMWGSTLNMLEHLCYTASSVLVVAWCWKIFGIKGED